MKKNSDDNCYVYKYTDPRNNEIFYIGLGVRNRKDAHIKEALKYKIPTDGSYINKKLERIKDIISNGQYPLIEIITQNLTRQAAYDLEHELIMFYGRFDKGNGSLLNQTNGYEFCKDKKSESMSSERRSESKRTFYKTDKGELNKQYLSKLYKDKIIGTPEEWLGEERGKELRKIRSINALNNDKFLHRDINGEKNPFYGKHHTEETKQIISAARKGIKLSKEACKHISNCLIERHAKNQLEKVPEYKVILPNDEIDYILTDDKCNFAKKHNIAVKSLNKIINGELIIFKGQRKNGFKIIKL